MSDLTFIKGERGLGRHEPETERKGILRTSEVNVAAQEQVLVIHYTSPSSNFLFLLLIISNRKKKKKGISL